MSPDYLHRHPEFADLIRIVANDMAIAPALVEKDYWIMHCLFGLQSQKFSFELKGGTSLSKGYGIIERFSEDIDIRIEPPPELDVKWGPNHSKPAHVESRREFYDWLAKNIRIDGIVSAERAHEFDDQHYRSGGIRLHYESVVDSVPGLKEGVLLEAGFDTVTPNQARSISSWAYDYAKGKVEVVDSRAIDVACYDPGYTLVEKLQTISTKFRLQQESGTFPINFMRHYYDVFKLLTQPPVQAFIGTPEYKAHKARRFRAADNPNLVENEAFHLREAATRVAYERAYNETGALYYRGKPTFGEILAVLAEWASRL